MRGPFAEVARVLGVFAHRSEVERGALPGVVAAMSEEEREQLLGTEWFSRAPADVLASGSPGDPHP